MSIYVKQESTLDPLVPEFSQILLEYLHPINSVYMSYDNVDPSTIFGGEWQRIKGRFLVGVDEDDNTFNDAGVSGGEKVTTLDITQIPSHSHVFTGQTIAHTHSATSANNSQQTTSSTSISHTHGGTTDSKNISHTHTGTTSTNGSHKHNTQGYRQLAKDEYVIGTRNGMARNNIKTDPVDSNNPIQSSGSHNHTFTTSSSGGSHTHSFTTGSAGGSHTHTVAAHNHSVTVANSNILPKGTISETGESQSHNNLPPYETVYMWRRIA